MTRLYLFLILTIAFCCNYKNFAECCNELKCASIVSKCLLAQSCKCTRGVNDYVCYQQCKKCLGKHYYAECCDCVELCSSKHDEHENDIRRAQETLKQSHTSLSSKSHVEDFEGLPELFNALVTNDYANDDNNKSYYDDDDNNWRYYTYAVDLIDHNPHTHTTTRRHTNTINEVQRPETLSVNCTVLYLHQCTSWNKCRHSCRAVGASSYRWFHDGCCECVGPTCVNYGLNESRCKYCPQPDDDMLEDDYDEEWLDERENEDNQETNDI